jgi:hypothetical protein
MASGNISFTQIAGKVGHQYLLFELSRGESDFTNKIPRQRFSATQ